MTGFSTRPHTIVLLAAVLLLMLALVGCGDDGDGTDTTAGVVTTGAATETTSGDTATTSPGGATNTTGAGADAATLYDAECAGCHGAAGEGGVGPALQGRDDLTAEQAEVTIRQGGGGMPAFEGQLTDQQIQGLAQYVTEDLGG